MKDRVAAGVALLALAVAVIRIFVALHDWAAGSFARPALASALLAVVQMAILLVALAIAPALAKLVRRALGL